MNNDLFIRKATLEDLVAILDLFRNTIRHTCQNDYTEVQIAVWISGIENQARWKRAIEEQFFIVAEQKNEIVGFASLENGNYIDFLYVHYNHQRKGIASLLLDAIQAEAEWQGKTIFWSHVSKTARPFFERKGFEVIRENYKMVEGVEIMNYCMKKN
ncbi:MAG: GNAT family N-acetyltransferase [Bacteroidota bacterium]